LKASTIGFGIVGLAVSSVASAQFGAGPAEIDLVKVTDNVYVIHNAYVPGNITALVTDEGVLIIDTKFAVDND